jgi:hypothetical protein
MCWGRLHEARILLECLDDIPNLDCVSRVSLRADGEDKQGREENKPRGRASGKELGPSLWRAVCHAQKKPEKNTQIVKTAMPRT